MQRDLEEYFFSLDFRLLLRRMDSAKQKLSRMTIGELNAMAIRNKIDIGDVQQKTKAEIVDTLAAKMYAMFLRVEEYHRKRVETDKMVDKFWSGK